MGDELRENMEFDSQLYCQLGKLALGVMRYSLGYYVSKSRVVGKRQLQLSCSDNEQIMGFMGYGNWDFVISVAMVVLKLWVVMWGKSKSECENPFTTNLSEKTSSFPLFFHYVLDSSQLFDLGDFVKN